MDQRTIITNKGNTLLMTRPIEESKSLFNKRIDFYQRGLEYIKRNESKIILDTYASMYINKIKYKVTYDKKVEKIIEEILKDDEEEELEFASEDDE